MLQKKNRCTNTKHLRRAFSAVFSERSIVRDLIIMNWKHILAWQAGLYLEIFYWYNYTTTKTTQEYHYDAEQQEYHYDAAYFLPVFLWLCQQISLVSLSSSVSANGEETSHRIWNLFILSIVHHEVFLVQHFMSFNSSVRDVVILLLTWTWTTQDHNFFGISCKQLVQHLRRTACYVDLREWERPDNYKTCQVLEVYEVYSRILK